MLLVWDKNPKVEAGRRLNLQMVLYNFPKVLIYWVKDFSFPFLATKSSDSLPHKLDLKKKVFLALRLSMNCKHI